MIDKKGEEEKRREEKGMIDKNEKKRREENVMIDKK